MSTLTQFLHKEEPPSKFQLFSNTWAGYLGYLLKRNSGYGQRKVLNLINEVVELSCIAWVMDISFLRSLILIPIAHICINYIQEYHWQLFRYAPATWFKKKVNALDQGLWGLSSLIFVAVGFQIFRRHNIDPLLLILFSLRAITVVFQVALAPFNARFTSLKRVRPNISFIWMSSILTWILAISMKALPLDIYYAIAIGILFNLLKVLQELSFYQSVKKEKYKQRLVSLHPRKEINTTQTVGEAAVLIFLHLFILLGFSLRFHLLYFGFVPVVTFFILSFCDRLNSRPFRSVALDFLFLEQKRYTLLKQAFIRRTLLFSFLFCAGSTLVLSIHRSWPLPAQVAIFIVILNSMLSNSLICSRSVRHPGVHFFILSQALSCIVLLFSGPHSFILFLVIQAISFGLGIFSLTRKDDNRILLHPHTYQFEWNPLIPLWKNFLTLTEQKQFKLISLTRKHKIISVPNEQVWLDLLNAFPVNIRKWKRISAVPAKAPKKIPENTRLVHMDLWGFWSSDDDLSKFLHQTSRNFLIHPFHFGGKISWKTQEEDTVQAEAGPANPEGTTLWVK